jgi:hypothetical protein
MNMVFHATYDQGLHFVRARNAAQIRPEALLEVGFDHRATLLGREHAVHQTTDKRVHD